MTQTQIPDQMTTVVLDSYSGAEALRVEQRPVPKPGKDEVLVKVAASPINPSDLAFLDGNYGFDNPPPWFPAEKVRELLSLLARERWGAISSESGLLA